MVPLHFTNRGSDSYTDVSLELESSLVSCEFSAAVVFVEERSEQRQQFAVALQRQRMQAQSLGREAASPSTSATRSVFRLLPHVRRNAYIFYFSGVI